MSSKSTGVSLTIVCRNKLCFHHHHHQASSLACASIVVCCGFNWRAAGGPASPIVQLAALITSFWLSPPWLVFNFNANMQEGQVCVREVTGGGVWRRCDGIKFSHTDIRFQSRWCLWNKLWKQYWSGVNDAQDVRATSCTLYKQLLLTSDKVTPGFLFKLVFGWF